jgi:hypothetical protein
MVDGKQKPNAFACVSCALGALGAIMLAHLMARRNRAIYVVEQETDTYTKHSE